MSEYDGFKYEVNCPIFKYHIEKGISEPYPNHIKVVRKYQTIFPHKNRTYIDIGGHIGTTALPYSRMFQNVYVYEPNRENYELLTKNIFNNKVLNITSVPKGIYNEECKGLILQHGNNSGCYYFHKQEDGEISCITLDSQKHKDVDFIKIDIEGAEFFALEGGIETIKKYKPLIHLEINGLSERNYNIESNKIFNFVKELGYVLFSKPDDNNYFFYYPELERIIYSFWTGSNQMSDNRKRCMEQFKNTSGCTTKLISSEILNEYILDSNPLHPAYQYLSETHKADYLRTYFMHFYGGGYSDIKMTCGDWNDAFKSIEDRPEMLASGYTEMDAGCIAYTPYCQYYKDLIGNGAYIFHPNTDLTKEWYNSMLSLLDSKLEKLKENPAQNPQDCSYPYPIEWNEMLGRIFHKICYDYKDKLLHTVPYPIFQNYR
jgi:FkbM family methyltransferase